MSTSTSSMSSSTSPPSSSNGSYPKLAQHMCSWLEMAVFRRFSALMADEMLDRQAELTYLEDELTYLRENEEEKWVPLDANACVRSSQYWQLLSEKEDGKHSPHYLKKLEIREKLAQFSKFIMALKDCLIVNDFVNHELQFSMCLMDSHGTGILQYHSLMKLNAPTPHDLKSLRRYLQHEAGGDNFLTSCEADPYRSDRPDLAKDLVTMCDAHHERDLFSAWLADHFTAWFEQKFGHWMKRKDADVESGLTHYNDTRLNAVSRFVGTLLASLLPAVSIFALYFIQDMLARLGAIMAFSAVFAFTLAVCTRATRVEIFAATAAYVAISSLVIIALCALLMNESSFASVQVVFVGSTRGD